MTGDGALTTNQGLPIADDQNSLKGGARGPTLLEDFILREKITHFDHERIPERVVHARGYGVHGHFQPYESHAELTKAAFLQDPAVKTPVFVRWSTVAGSKGSVDLARDVRGFSVKFYTSEGNFDIVGNNIPVFFIQDAIKFPDLIHAVKPEPDRDFPQAQSAHDTFWDFVSLTPESMHMLMWVMSDRAIPRSFRHMEGFGVHTFRLVTEDGTSRFIKWHFKPVAGNASVLWDEAVKTNGADPDFHRRDVWNSLEAGKPIEFELGVQVFDEEQANAFDFDVLDATKLIPEEIIPVTKLGKLVLDRRVDNFFAETEQVAFCPSHLVPGIDFSDDPLLQGRLFSYLDTQLSRLGSPNFHEIGINAPKCPFANLQQDGHMRMRVPKGRALYEPSSLDDGMPRETPAGFVSHPAAVPGPKLRQRPESFADHYTQARLFWRSQEPHEQSHIVNGFAFELGNVEAVKVRRRMLGHLQIVDEELGERVADALGMSGQAEDITPAVAPHEMEPSPALSLMALPAHGLAFKKVGALVTDGVDGDAVDALREALMAEGAELAIVAPKIGGVEDSQGRTLPADKALSAGPSVLFDHVVLLPSEAGVEMLLGEAAAIDWVRDAFGHLKILGYNEASVPLLEAGGVPTEVEGVVPVDDGPDDFVAKSASTLRVWDREPSVRSPG